MKILYGIQGTGHGHVIRSREVVQRLRALGHEVHCILSARSLSSFPGLEVFEPCTLFRGFTAHAIGGRINFVRSIGQLKILKFFRDVAAFDASGFDLAVTDFDPVTGWIAKRNRMPGVGIGHLYAYRHPIRLPRRTRSAELLLRLFLPIYTPIKTMVGIHWHHFGAPNLPPTIPSDLRDRPTEEQKKVVVYLPGESRDRISALLRRFEPYQFFIYGRDQGPVDEGNLHFRPHDREGFVRHLLTASGVLTNAGFSLISEALHLGKKALVKPIGGHTEQHLNGKALPQLGLGTVMHRLDPDVLAAWLESPQPEPLNYPDVVGHFAQWIHEGHWDDPSALARRAWSEVTWPGKNMIPWHETDFPRARIA